MHRETLCPIRLKKLLKATKKKMKDFENGQKQPISMKEGSYRGSHETDSDVLKLKEKVMRLVTCDLHSFIPNTKL